MSFQLAFLATLFAIFLTPLHCNGATRPFDPSNPENRSLGDGDLLCELIKKFNLSGLLTNLFPSELLSELGLKLSSLLKDTNPLSGLNLNFRSLPVQNNTNATDSLNNTSTTGSLNLAGDDLVCELIKKYNLSGLLTNLVPPELLSELGSKLPSLLGETNPLSGLNLNFRSLPVQNDNNATNSLNNTSTTGSLNLAGDDLVCDLIKKLNLSGLLTNLVPSELLGELVSKLPSLLGETNPLSGLNLNFRSLPVQNDNNATNGLNNTSTTDSLNLAGADLVCELIKKFNLSGLLTNLVPPELLSELGLKLPSLLGDTNPLSGLNLNFRSLPVQNNTNATNSLNNTSTTGSLNLAGDDLVCELIKKYNLSGLLTNLVPPELLSELGSKLPSLLGETNPLSGLNLNFRSLPVQNDNNATNSLNITSTTGSLNLAGDDLVCDLIKKLNLSGLLTNLVPSELLGELVSKLPSLLGETNLLSGLNLNFRSLPVQNDNNATNGLNNTSTTDSLNLAGDDLVCELIKKFNLSGLLTNLVPPELLSELGLKLPSLLGDTNPLSGLNLNFRSLPVQNDTIATNGLNNTSTSDGLNLAGDDLVCELIKKFNLSGLLTNLVPPELLSELGLKLPSLLGDTNSLSGLNLNFRSFPVQNNTYVTNGLNSTSTNESLATLADGSLNPDSIGTFTKLILDIVNRFISIW